MACQGCLEKRALIFDALGFESKRATEHLFYQFAEAAVKFPSSHVTRAAAMLIVQSMRLTHSTVSGAHKNVDEICESIKTEIERYYQASGDRKIFVADAREAQT